MTDQSTQSIPAGYRQTEVGVIPNDWHVLPLPDVFIFIGGKAHERSIVDYGKYISVNSKFISTDGRVKKFSDENYCPARKGDILMVMSDLPNGKALAKCFLVDENNRYAVNQRVCILRAKKDNSNYLFFILNRNPYFLQYDDGVQQTHLLNDVFRKCPVVVPSMIEEQTAIANTLSDTDALTKKLATLIEKKKKIRQGAMQEFLTGKRRLPGFSGEWKVEKLRELLDYERPDKYIVGGDAYQENARTPVLTANKSFVLGYTNEESGIYHDLPAIIFDDFTTDSKYVDFPFKVKSSAIKILRSKTEGTNLKFLHERLRIIRFPLGGHKRYYISEYQNLEIPMPRPGEQTAIATVLSDMDAEIKALEQSLAKYKMLKHGMMQVLLTGKIRLMRT